MKPPAGPAADAIPDAVALLDVMEMLVPAEDRSHAMGPEKGVKFLLFLPRHVVLPWAGPLPYTLLTLPPF